MESNKSLGLSESIFGGVLNDGTGIFGKSSGKSPPLKRQKRHENDQDKKPTIEKTALQAWNERQKGFGPVDQQDNAYTLVREAGEPEHAFAEEVSSTIKHHGIAVVKNVIDGKTLEQLKKCANNQRNQICKALQNCGLTYNDNKNNEQEVRFQEVVVRCKGRMDARYREDKNQEDPFWKKHSLLHKIIGTLLFGEEHTPTLVYAGWIFSFAGSDDQPWHQDGIPLFPGNGVTPNLPPYAVNVFIPLSDEDSSLKAGPTEFAVGSHRMDVGTAMEATTNQKEDGVACPVLSQGDLLFYDYRICHRGTANLTNVSDDDKDGNTSSEGRVRNILYLMYARPWFKEHLNFGNVKLFEK